MVPCGSNPNGLRQPLAQLWFSCFPGPLPALQAPVTQPLASPNSLDHVQTYQSDPSKTQPQSCHCPWRTLSIRPHALIYHPHMPCCLILVCWPGLVSSHFPFILPPSHVSAHITLSSQSLMPFFVHTVPTAQCTHTHTLPPCLPFHLSLRNFQKDPHYHTLLLKDTCCLHWFSSLSPISLTPGDFFCSSSPLSSTRYAVGAQQMLGR